MLVGNFLGFAVVVAVVVGVTEDYKSCNLLEMGGVGDGETDNTQLLRKSFLTCDEVIIPYGGTYLTHPLNITRDNFALILEGTLLFFNMSNLTNWPVMPHLPSYPCDRDICACCRYQPPLLVYQTNNVTIKGQGELNGNGADWWTARNNGTLQYGRPRLLETMQASKVKILNVKLVDSPFWTCHLWSSQGIYVEGVKVYAPKHSPNTDGFNPDSSKYVHIKNCEVHNGDDCVSVKSGMNSEGIAYNVSSAHIFVENLKCSGGHGMSIGSEMSGGVEDVIISNSQLHHELRIKTNPARGGYIRDITYINLDILQEPNYDGGVILIQTNYSNSDPPAPTPPIIDNIRYEGINGKGESAGKFECDETIPCTNIIAVDIHMESEQGWTGTCDNKYVQTAYETNVYPPWCPDTQ